MLCFKDQTSVANRKQRLKKMELKVYADRLSQPSRAIVIFCKVNGIDFEEVGIELLKGQHKTPEFKGTNPMGQVPAIVVDEKFKLFESHAILIFLASAFPGVAEHWYPTDIYKRAEIHSVLDWHHSNLRRGSTGLIVNSVLAPILFGRPLDPQAASEAEKLLTVSLSRIESLWLKEGGQFLLGGNQPSIADLSLVCEIMQLQLVDETVRSRILGPFTKVQQWVEDTKKATSPHFDEVHQALFGAKAKLQEQQSTSSAQ